MSALLEQAKAVYEAWRLGICREAAALPATWRGERLPKVVSVPWMEKWDDLPPERQNVWVNAVEVGNRIRRTMNVVVPHATEETK